MIYMLIELVVSTVLLIPVFLILQKIRLHTFRLTIIHFLFAAYLAAVYLLVGLPTSQFIRFDINFSLIPFVGMIDDLRNTILNVLLFIPLGFFLPLLWRKYQAFHNIILFGLSMTLSIECLQLFNYRATDINDIITNVFGTVIGFFLFGFFKKPISKFYTASNRTNDMSVLFFSVIAVMFFIQPWVMTGVYYII